MSTTARGYGAPHQRLRERWARQVDRGEVQCARCGRQIKPGTPWQLDHADYDRTQYLGPSHAWCNLQAAMLKGRRKRSPRVSSRVW